MSEKNCPFYGRHMYVSVQESRRGLPFLLLRQDGNQCGLITHTYSPCYLESNKQPVEWPECPVMKDARLQGTG